jgi:hypothetical protein
LQRPIAVERLKPTITVDGVVEVGCGRRQRGTELGVGSRSNEPLLANLAQRDERLLGTMVPRIGVEPIEQLARRPVPGPPLVARKPNEIAKFARNLWGNNELMCGFHVE